MDKTQGAKILAIKARIVANFNAGHWQEIGLITGESETIDNYPRLLRSLSWGDSDYDGNVIGVLLKIAETNPKALQEIEDYLNERWPGESEFISSKPAHRTITFAPNVFEVPNASVENDLVAVMMPFRTEFSPVYTAITNVCQTMALRCLRGDDIWEESVIIQDIFNLIFRSHVVIADFTGKNPNVMYETGIAHTLGKTVVPISQSLDDLPFDLAHHRALKYLANEEGLEKLKADLRIRLIHFAPNLPF